MRLVVAAVYCLIAVEAAAFQSPKLTGDLFVTMQSGDVKRGADVAVAVVPASAAFTEDWQQLQTRYEQEVFPVLRDDDWLETQYHATRDSRTFFRLSNEMHQIATTRWVPLQRQYTDAALETIRKHAKATTRTDVNRHFEFAGLEPGKYFVHARHAVYDNLLYWLVPIDVQGDSKLSLSNSNGKLHSPLEGRTYTKY